MSWRYIEPCCGSAAVAFALLGARRAVLPYQGSKWRFRKPIVAAFRRLGVVGTPRRVELYDPGPWGIAAHTLVDATARAAVIGQLDVLAQRDAREVFDALHQHAIPDDPAAYTARFLFLQRLSYSGKAVGTRDGVWVSPGFNTSSAYGLPGTDRFGAVNPMIPSLIRALRGYEGLARPATLCGGQISAAPPTEACKEPTVVYLDPPYAGSTAYPGGDLDRDAVVALARAWAEAGAHVVISEAEAPPALVADGWSAERIDAGRDDTSPFRGKQAEWLTISPRA